MNRKQFLRIIELQRKKMTDLNKSTETIFQKSFMLLDDPDKEFITGFVAHLKNKIESDIEAWTKLEVWEKGWVKRDVYYKLNLRPLFPVLFKEYFDVPEKDNSGFKATYKDLSKVLFKKYPYLNGWKRAFSEHYDTYRRTLCAEMLHTALRYSGEPDVEPIKGLLISAAADIISAMRTYQRLPNKQKRDHEILERLKKGVKGVVISGELNISIATISRIKKRYRSDIVIPHNT